MTELIPTSRMLHQAWARTADYSTIPVVQYSIDILRCSQTIHSWVMDQLAAHPGMSLVEILSASDNPPSAAHTTLMVRQLQIDAAFAATLPGNPAASLVDPLPGELVTRMAAAWVGARSTIEYSQEQHGEIPAGQPVHIPEMAALEELSAAYDNMITDLVEGRRRLRAPEEP